MSWLDTVRTGLEAIRAHRLRSALTMLGILIGIAAVILTVGLGIGAQRQVAAQVQALGTNLLIISPGSATTDGVRGGLGSASTLTQADADSLASPVVAPDIAAVAATTSGSATLQAGSSNWTTTVVGTQPAWLPVRARSLSAGRFLTADDERGAATVAVLGATTAAELFGPVDAVGQSGHVLSPHYDDALTDWSGGRTRKMRMDRAEIEQCAIGHLRLLPK